MTLSCRCACANALALQQYRNVKKTNSRITRIQKQLAGENTLFGKITDQQYGQEAVYFCAGINLLNKH
jgi:hypothetical protein